LLAGFVAVVLVTPVVVPSAVSAAAVPCPIFPADNVWNADISQLPVHARSANWLASMAASTTHLHPDFGPSYGAQPVPYGIPFTVVTDSHPKVQVSFTYASESDPGPYPFGSDTPIEGGPSATGDRHAIMVDSGTCELYELFDAHYASSGSTAGSGATWDLYSDALRPAGWTSADAAGLPILAGLLRPDEVAAGVVTHAIRMTAVQTDRSYVWPARHQAGTRSDATLPPMGARFRLNAGFDVSGYRPDSQVVLAAMKRYGMILADNGSNWYFGGSSDTSWDPALIDDLKRVPASAFEAVDESSLMVSADSGATTGGAPPAGTTRLQGGTRYGTAGAVAAAAFPNGASTAVVVSGTTYPDALTGAYLASAVGGPVLLTDRDTVPPELTQTLDALHVNTIDLLGGPLAIGKAVEQQLAGRASTTVTRIAGQTRYDTMATVDSTPPAAQVGMVGGKPTAILASGAGFADALASSGVSYKAHLPIILTDPQSLSPQASATIKSLGITQLLIMGGTGALSTTVEQQANADGAATLARFGGTDRTDTAQLLAAYAVTHFGFANTEILLARGDGFADALASSAYAAGSRPMLLAETPDQLGAPTTGYISANKSAISTFTALGGPSAISNATLSAAVQAKHA
jgi:putative cell wall-binding protein